MKRNAMIILNPSSGTEKSKQFQHEVEEVLNKQGYHVITKCTEKEYDAKKFAEEACEENMELVTVLGGDGTVNEVINGIAERTKRPTLHIIPLGTVNNFARALGIPLKPRDAIEVIRDPHVMKADLGKVNDQFFINLVNVGAIAEATYQVTPEQKSKLGSIAYFLEGFKKFTEKDMFSVTISTDESSRQIEAMLVLVAVTNTVAGWENMLQEAEIDDGYLHVFAVKEISTLESVSMITSLLNGSLKDQKQVEYWKAKKVTVDTIPTKVANIDGDEGMQTPLQFSVLEKHIKIMNLIG
ncbi:diacylglycerol/lipid kinase family protein [Gracilibacillus sp. D59]|uniref:diacylglycerol/lipid kinase family protein n=1 Tax=Gracilibacillus sp. D59 TaxID=3457434 RepID=UPI003FCD202D